MAYPSNDNKGAKNLVDFVVHLRDAEDAFGDVVNKAKEDIRELISAVQGIDDTSTSTTGVWSSEKVSTEVAASNAAAQAARNAADAAQASAAAAQSRADKGVADAATAKGVADKAASDLAAEVSRAVAAEQAASNAAAVAQQTADSKAPISHATSETTYGRGSSSLYGHVKLSDNTASTSSVSSGVAATPKAVKAVNDAVNAEKARAEAAEAALNGDISASDAALRALIAEEVAKYLPLAGGTMTGAITAVLNDVLKRSVNSGALSIHGGQYWDVGATLELVGKDRANNPGSFLLEANDGSFIGRLFGKPDGTLTWNGKNVETVDSIGNTGNGGWLRYTNGLQICWGNTPASNQWGDASVSFGKPFISDWYGVSAITLDTSANTLINAPRLTNHTKDYVGFKTCYISYDQVTYASGHVVFFVAIGRWK